MHNLEKLLEVFYVAGCLGMVLFRFGKSRAECFTWRATGPRKAWGIFGRTLSHAGARVPPPRRNWGFDPACNGARARPTERGKLDRT